MTLEAGEKFMIVCTPSGMVASGMKAATGIRERAASSRTSPRAACDIGGAGPAHYAGDDAPCAVRPLRTCQRVLGWP